jgi:hypothetical protein
MTVATAPEEKSEGDVELGGSDLHIKLKPATTLGDLYKETEAFFAPLGA